MWIGVSQRFSQFYATALLTNAQYDDGLTKQSGVRACLNRHYYSSANALANSVLVGSWGKQTQVRPPYDLRSGIVSDSGNLPPAGHSGIHQNSPMSRFISARPQR
jgi:hypothetical protein